MKVSLLAYMQPDQSIDMVGDNPVDMEDLIAVLMHSTRRTESIRRLLSEQTEPKKKERIKNSVELGHSTVAGMTDFIFLIEGVSRNLTHQLVRHRTAWYLQQSQRKVNIVELPMTHPSSAVERRPFLVKEFDEYWREAYQELIDAGVPREDARYYAPHGLHTRIVMKIDGCNLIHFLNLRTSDRAQWEIRELAGLMYKKVKPLFPNLFDEDLKEDWW